MCATHFARIGGICLLPLWSDVHVLLHGLGFWGIWLDRVIHRIVGIDIVHGVHNEVLLIEKDVRIRAVRKLRDRISTCWLHLTLLHRVVAAKVPNVIGGIPNHGCVVSPMLTFSTVTHNAHQGVYAVMDLQHVWAFNFPRVFLPHRGSAVKARCPEALQANRKGIGKVDWAEGFKNLLCLSARGLCTRGASERADGAWPVLFVNEVDKNVAVETNLFAALFAVQALFVHVWSRSTDSGLVPMCSALPHRPHCLD